MAEGRREVVQDPLAFNPRENTPVRQLATGGVSNPGKGPRPESFQDAQAGLAALGSLRQAAVSVLASKKDDLITQGKLDYMSGVTEAQMIASGDRYTKQGYETLSSVDKANTWYLKEQQGLAENGARMDPEEYKAYIMKSRAEQLKNLPADPAVRKVYVAAFEDLAPRLVEAQMKANNEYNTNTSIMTAKNTLISGASANADASRVMPNSTLRVSPTVVAKPVVVPVMDRDILIKTVLGEAAGESEEGMAAVAHVLRNRAADRRWAGSVREVALQENQFSAWNKGAGGNNPHKWKPGTPAYERAGRIVDIVMAGRHVDPTGGATHYYSPGGMKQLVAGGTQKNLIPRWLDQEALKSGGTIRLGNHIFVGRSEGVERSVDDSGRSGAPAGYSDPRPFPGWEKDGSAKPYADGSFPDLTGLVPMPGSGTEIAATQLDSPQAVANASGTPVTPPAGYGTQVQALLQNAQLSPENKAIALAQAYEETLDSGSDQLFNDGGGLGTLTRLGADEKLIDRVAKAKDRFEKKQLDKYDVGKERFRSDLLAGIDAGEVDSVDEIFAALDDKEMQESMSEQDKRSLAREAINKLNQAQEKARTASEKAAEENAKTIPVEMHTKLASIYTQIADGDLSAEEASAQAKATAEQYGVSEEVVKGLVKDMFSRKEQANNKLRTEAETKLKRKQKSDEVVAQVQTALSSDSGLANVDGVVVLPDGKEVPAKKYGIMEIQRSVRNDLQAGIQSGNIQEENAQGLYYKQVYGKLRKHGVVDEDFAAQLSGALTGNIVQKNGQLTDGARQAFDVYMQFREDPGTLGTEYFSQMVKDPAARMLVTNAGIMYDGRFGMDDALLKAHELLASGNANNAKIQPDIGFNIAKEEGVRKALTEAMETPGWFSDQTIASADRAAILKQTKVADQYVLAQANIYTMQNPTTLPAAALKMALEDLSKNAVIVGNNILIGNSDSKQRLDQVMGLEGADKTLPQRAIEDALVRNGPTVWGQLWTDRIGKINKGVFRTREERDAFSGLGPDSGTTVPPYYATYNPQTKAISVQLYEDGKRERPIGRPMIISAPAAGARLRDAMSKPSWLADQFRGAKEGVVDFFTPDPNAPATIKDFLTK